MPTKKADTNQFHLPPPLPFRKILSNKSNKMPTESTKGRKKNNNTLSE